MTVEELIKKKPDGLIARAWKKSAEAHEGQRRKDGEPFFTHCREVAETLASWNMGDEVIAAGLLHDIVEDTAVTDEELEGEFGRTVRFLVDAVTKLGHVKYRGNTQQVQAAKQAENLRKLLLALSDDVRVIIIKFADRLHNMRTLSALPAAKQKRIALETEEIYAPLAERLGMLSVAGELHELAFPYVFPKEAEWIQKTVSDRYEERMRYLEGIQPELAKLLKAEGITPKKIDIRAKRYYSLYKKLVARDMNLDKVYDLVAIRVIVDSISECYAVLGIVHQVWPPVPGRFKDYIATPKFNGYRSLHTTVVGPNRKIIEVQIRTGEMHEQNELGIAAHWLYKQDKLGGAWVKKFTPEITKEIEWVKRLRTWHESRSEERSPEEALLEMKIDFFKDRIFALTPAGDVLDLPDGATPIDFAYYIHSDLGNTCVGAKVNGEFVPLNHILRSGDMVEVITQKNKRPSEDWLNFVKTHTARDQIKEALRRRPGLLREGRGAGKTELRIVAADRTGLFKDIATIISRSHINITGIHTNVNPRGNFPVGRFECATTDRDKIERLIVKIKRVAGVKEVSYRIF